ncbi:hypothetical protein L6255_04275 [Candidatus Parcubacteria bacterium]|nr:hypothetical protein [Patescibacteria group bacterium]MCG2689626.1 hypothetical protein [Candidatus Parcubacteria bacterium]
MSKKRHKNEIKKLRAKIEMLKSQVSPEVLKQVEPNLITSDNKIDSLPKISEVVTYDMTTFIVADFRKSVVISILLFGIIIYLCLFGDNPFTNF